MTAESLIRRRLIGAPALAEKLAQYADAPAVFYAAPPDDTDRGWRGGRQYPHIEFSVDWRNEPEYDTGGTVNADVVCAATSAMPEEIAQGVRRSLAGVFFAPTDAHVFVLAWEATQAYQMGALIRQEPLICGLTLTFRLTAFPERETIDPDPIMALNRYAAAWNADTMSVRDLHGRDFYEPTDAHPVLYFRPLDKTTAQMTNTVVWIDANIALHLYAPTAYSRQMWLEAFAQQLTLDGEVTLMDGSPMFVRTIKGSGASDEQSGQLTLGVRYGLLRRRPYAHPLRHAYWNSGEAGSLEEHAAVTTRPTQTTGRN